MFENFWKKKKVRWIALLLVMVMVFSLLPMDINLAESVAGLAPSATEEVSTAEVSSNDTEISEETVTETETEAETEAVTEAAAETGEQEIEEPSRYESGNTQEGLITKEQNMLSTGNFDLTNLELSASYLDSNHVRQDVAMTTTENVTLPDDATISLNFDYIMRNGDDVVIGQEYVYPIPSAIRIDVDEVLELITAEGNSIGTVHIDKVNQRLVFVFNDNVKQQTNIPFYVRFAGGLSADANEDSVDEEIIFDTARGHFNYNVTVEDSYTNTEPSQPGELGMEKTGRVVYVGDKPYIEWDLSLNLNGRDSLDAVISDILPAGLTYVEAGGYPKITDTKDNNATLVATQDSGKVTFTVSNVTTYHRAHVRFLTAYDNDIFTGEINNNTSATIANTASITENGSTSTETGDGNVTIKPSVLSKTGTQSGGVITWTVTINKDQLDVGGATYTDTFGSGYGWNTANGEYNASCISVTPAGSGVISANADGFSFVVDENNKNDVITLVYQTKIEDYTQSTYKNDATLTEPGKYNLSTSSSVHGYNLISKNNVTYNEVLRQLKWTITVNADKADSVFDGVGDVVIRDVFNPNVYQNKMKLVSMKITGASGASQLSDFDSCTADENGNITVPASKLKGTTLTITVVTEVLAELNDNYTPAAWETPQPWTDGNYVNAKNDAVLEWDGNSVTGSASRSFIYRKPDLLSKSGEPSKYDDNTLKRDGIVNWTIVSNAYQRDMTINTITLTDTVPDGMTYVPGSLYICSRYANFDVNGRTYVTPSYDEATRVLTVTLNRTDTAIASRFDSSNNFEIHYQTRACDRDKIGTTQTYTNHAEFEVEYDGYSTVIDDDSATVTEDVGGVLRKEALYQSGNNYVDWEVAINEGRFNLSDVDNPVIRDRLAEYLQYVQNSGHLYRVDLDGNRTEVTSGFLVNVINNEMVVSLPNIGSDSYIFTFRTRFTISQSQAASLSFSNDISFQGTGITSSVTSNNVRNVSFSSSSAGAYHENELRLRKLDPNGNVLAGAVFQICDAMGTVIAEETTDASGQAVFRGVKSFADGYTYRLIELTAPDGYVLDSTPVPVKITSWQTDTDGTRYYELDVENEPILKSTSFSIQKTDGDGQAVSGAEFSVYDALPMNDDSLVNKKASGENGKLTFTVPYNENNNTIYYVAESQTPDGYKLPASGSYYEVVIGTDGSVVSVTNQPGGINVTLNTDTFTVQNEAITGSFKLTKVDQDNHGSKIPGASFTLYSDAQCTDDVATVTTDADGVALFTNLEVGKTYYYREVTPPAGYLLDDTIHSVTITDDSLLDANGWIHQDVSVSATVENEQEKGSIRIVKTDDGTPAKLIEGAEFTLYSASDLTTPFLKPGTTTPYVVTTDANGSASFEDLPYGRYVVMETNVPTGYQVSASGNRVSVTVNSQNANTVNIVNDVVRFALKVVKTDDSTNPVPLAGAYFVVRNSSGVIAADGETGEDGTITFDNLPYDTYTVTETRGVPGYVMATVPQTVNAGDIVNNGTIVRTFTNHKESGSIRFTKVDKDSGEKLSGAVFTLYNEAGEKVKTASSDSNGIVEFTDLSYGTYTIRETKAPNRYQLSAKEWTVEVTDDTPVVVLVSVLDHNTTGSVTNEKIPSGNNYMHFKLLKSDANGNPLEGAQFQLTKKFPNDGNTYGTSNTNGAPITYTAYSDADGVVEFKDVYIEHDPDETTYTLKEIKAPFGYSVTQEIIIDHYTKKQMVGDGTSTGIALGTERPFDSTPGAVVPDITDSIGIAAENLVVSSGNTYLVNKQLLGNIMITKKAAGAVNQFLSGAEFTLYKWNAATNKYEKFSSSGLKNPGKTDENGILSFKKLPLGKYRVVETKAPDGYVLDAASRRDFEITEDNYNDTTVLSATILDTPISISVNKYAIGGSTQLSGAVLGLYRAGDTAYANCLERWTTGTTAHKISSDKLAAGNEYMIHEISAPKGYTVIPEDVRFKVNSNGTVTYTGTAGSEYGMASGTSVTIRDKAYSLSVSKVGISADASQPTAPLSGASISLIDDETGNVVHTFTSTNQVYEVPNSVLTGPLNGKEYHYYTIHENSAPGGYALADDIKIAVDAAGHVYKTDTQGNKVNDQWSQNTVTMEDEKYEDFYFIKKDKSTGTNLAGATFAIYEASVWEADPTASNTGYATDLVTGSSLKWTSTTVSKNASLDIGTYYLVELKAPKGYAITSPVKFRICDGTPKYMEILKNGENSRLSSNKLTLSCLDKKLEVKFVKWSDDMRPLIGGKFTLHASDANKKIGTKLGNSFAATGGLITFANDLFEVNHYYAVVEDEAPDGYEKTEPMFFYIDENGTMKDLDGDLIDENLLVFIDGAKQVGFQKTDKATGAALSGVEMSITSKDDADFTEITWTTDGSVKYVPAATFKKDKTYVLTEKKTIAGYSYAASKSFQYITGTNGGDDRLYVDGTPINTMKIVMEDQPIEVYIDKMIAGTNRSLEGASLQVTDENHNVIDSWVTDGSAHKLDSEQILVSATSGEHIYTLSEVQAPEFYACAQPISFYVDKTGKVRSLDDSYVTDNTVKMYDEYAGIQISKQDTMGNELPGATLTISCNEDDSFTPISFTSTGTPYNLDRNIFKPGVTYTLTEEMSPAGYIMAAAVDFYVDADGNLYVNGELSADASVVMVDEDMTIRLAKKDASTHEYLSGALFGVYDVQTEDEVFTFESKNDITELDTSLLSVSAGKDKTFYCIRELEAPKGYELAKDVYFYIESNGDVYALYDGQSTFQKVENHCITIYDAPSENTTENTTEGTTETITTTSRKTGDSFPVGAVAALLLLGVTGMGIIACLGRRKKNDE